MKRLKKHDKVEVIVGKDKGKQGKIADINYQKNKVIVDGINVGKKTYKKTQQDQHGGIREIFMPLDISNVALVCTKCNKKTKVSYVKLKDNKVRKCKLCNEIID